jgi:cytochrome c-type biogenesis protein CcmH/NrfF
MRPLQTALGAAVLAAAVVTAPAIAQPAPAPGTATDVAADPALEKRVNALSAELRCLVCQNQSLADSHAPLAIDLKNQVREQLQAGRSERDVIDYMTQRYGDFVLYRPPLKASTLLLWAGPALLLLIGLTLFWRTLHQQGRREAGAAPVSADEARRADALLAADGQSTTAETKPK